MADNSPPTKLEEQDLTNLNICMPTVLCSSEVISPQAATNDGSNNDDIQDSTCSKTMMVKSKTICSVKQKSESDINPSKNKVLRYNEESLYHNSTALVHDNIALENNDCLNDIALFNDDIGLSNIDDLNDIALLSEDISLENIYNINDTALFSNNIGLENIDTALFSVDIGSENIDTNNDPPILSDDKNLENIEDHNDPSELSDDSNWEDIDDHNDPLASNDKGLENIDDHKNTLSLSVDIGSENIDTNNDLPILSDDKNLENIEDHNDPSELSDDSNWEDIDDHNDPLASNDKGLENIDDHKNISSSSDDRNWKDMDEISNNINNTPIDPILDLDLNEEQTKLYSFMNSDLRVKSFILEPTFYDDDVGVYDKNEIDEIIDVRFIFDTYFYLIKWKNWSRGFNTWERLAVLYQSQEHIFDYKRKNQCLSLYSDKPINILHLLLTRNFITKVFSRFRTASGLCLAETSIEDALGLINSLNNDLETDQIIWQKIFIRTYLSNMSLDFFRQLQFRELYLFWVDLMCITQNNNIRVENNIDLEGPPMTFVYLNVCIPKEGIIIPKNPSFGCNCKKNCQSNKCCHKLSGNVKAYDANKNIKVFIDYPIFECNDKCKCTSSCINRVVQLGSKVNVCIYKSRYPGWAIRTYDDINKGQFVGIYVGEILTVEEYNQRLQNCSTSIDYTWKLDFNGSKTNTYEFFIDSTKFGNFTRFINHSCEANLSIRFVWINCDEGYFPQLAFFANRKIFAGEQLTTDYFVRRRYDSMKKSGIKCHCETKSCKGYYF